MIKFRVQFKCVDQFSILILTKITIFLNFDLSGFVFFFIFHPITKNELKVTEKQLTICYKCHKRPIMYL